MSEINSTIILTVTFRNSTGNLVNPDSITGIITLPDTTVVDVTANIVNVSVGTYTLEYTPTQVGEYLYSVVGLITADSSSHRESVIFNVTQVTNQPSYEINISTSLDYLIGSLRAQIGDISTTPIFTDGYLKRILVDAFNSLAYRWQFRYILSDAYSVSRNSLGVYKFNPDVPSTPIIMRADERPIVLQAAIMVRSGNITTQFVSGSLGSWRDDELSYSNVSGQSTVQRLIERDQLELDSILPPRDRKLAKAKKQSLTGYQPETNFFEGSQ